MVYPTTIETIETIAGQHMFWPWNVCETFETFQGVNISLTKRHLTCNCFKYFIYIDTYRASHARRLTPKLADELSRVTQSVRQGD